MKYPLMDHMLICSHLSLILLFYFMFLLERHSKSTNDGNSTYSEEDDNPLDVEKVHEQPVAQHADKTYNPNRYYIFMHVHRCIRYQWCISVCYFILFSGINYTFSKNLRQQLKEGQNRQEKLSSRYQRYVFIKNKPKQHKKTNLNVKQHLFCLISFLFKR